MLISNADTTVLHFKLVIRQRYFSSEDMHIILRCMALKLCHVHITTDLNIRVCNKVKF